MRQYWELHPRMEDVEKLELYAQLTVSKHHPLDVTLEKAKNRSKNWEWKARLVQRRLQVRKRRGMKPKKKLRLLGWLQLWWVMRRRGRKMIIGKLSIINHYRAILI